MHVTSIATKIELNRATEIVVLTIDNDYDEYKYVHDGVDAIWGQADGRLKRIEKFLRDRYERQKRWRGQFHPVIMALLEDQFNEIDWEVMALWYCERHADIYDMYA